MKKVLVFLADGFEEIESLATVDILRRGGLDVTIVGVTGKTVTGSHNVQVIADKMIDEIMGDDFDAAICPGGMPGAENLRNNENVVKLIQKSYNKGNITAAICAAPMVLEKAEILKDKNFTMYPGMENYAPSGKYNSKEFVVKSDNVITGAGPAATFNFALEILANLTSKDNADTVAKGMLLK